MSMITENCAAIRERIHQAEQRAGRKEGCVRLIAVSKKQPTAAIEEALAAGQMVFGENYLQEAASKISLLGQRAHWHFIGQLQSNKARQAAELFDMIETIDRVKLAVKLNEHLALLGRTMDVLVQVNIGMEPQKAGVLPDAAEQLVAAVNELENLRLLGLMTMPPYDDNPEKVRPYFRRMRLLAEHLQQQGFFSSAPELSMGMSGDFEVAIEEGATMVRVGSSLFGVR